MMLQMMKIHEGTARRFVCFKNEPGQHIKLSKESFPLKNYYRNMVVLGRRGIDRIQLITVRSKSVVSFKPKAA